MKIRTLILGLCLTLGLAGCAGAQRPATTQNDKPASVPVSAPELPANVKLLDIYGKDGGEWTFVLISPRPNQAELVRIAQLLRQKNPEMKYEIFDDQSQRAQYVSWATASPGPNRPKFPEKWVSAHGVAMILPITDRDGTKWQLTDAFATPISPLE